MRQHSGHNFTPKQWERIFAHASLWHDVAQRFGRGFLLYLPVEDRSFSNSWWAQTKAKADHRLEKSPMRVRQWFLDTLNAGLPGIKNKVQVLNQFADRIMYHGNLKDIPRLEIESDDWQKGNKDLYHDGLSVQPTSLLPASPSTQCPESPPPQSPDISASMDDSQVIRSQSVPTPSRRIATGRARSLGMTRLRILSSHTPSADSDAAMQD